MLILQFFDAVESVGRQFQIGEPLNVWLVIRDRGQFESLAGMFLELLLRARNGMVVVQLEPTGVPILDRFAARLAERSNEDWAKWQLCRYAEIALEIMCYGLSRAHNPPRTPELLFNERQAPTFGKVRKLAQNVSSALPLNAQVWGTKFFASVLKNEGAKRALEEINTQRNNLAHGRATLPLIEMKELVARSLQLEAWPGISDTDGELRFEDWVPWIRASSATTRQTGLFERWEGNFFHYLVPETGEGFRMSRNENEPN